MTMRRETAGVVSQLPALFASLLSKTLALTSSRTQHPGAVSSPHPPWVAVPQGARGPCQGADLNGMPQPQSPRGANRRNRPQPWASRGRATCVQRMSTRMQCSGYTVTHLSEHANLALNSQLASAHPGLPHTEATDVTTVCERACASIALVGCASNCNKVVAHDHAS
jgi:hypothetical protein